MRGLDVQRVLRVVAHGLEDGHSRAVADLRDGEPGLLLAQFVAAGLVPLFVASLNVFDHCVPDRVHRFSLWFR